MEKNDTFHKQGLAKDHAHHHELKHFFKDIGIAGIAEIFVGIISILLIPLITKTLGAHDYGLWQQVMVSIGVLCPIAAFGLNNALVRFLPAIQDKKEKQEMVYAILIVEVFISSIIVCVMIYYSKILSYYFFDNATSIVMLTGFIFFIHEINFFCQFYFRALRKIKIYAIGKIADKFTKFIIIYYAIVSGKGIYEILLVFLIVETFFTIFYLAIMMYHEGVSFPHFSHMKSWVRYGLPLIPTGVASWVIMFSDRYIISYFHPFEQVGIYSAAYNLGFMVMYVITLIDFILLPTLSKMYDEHQHEKIKNLLQLILTFTLLLVFPYIVGLSVLSKPILLYFSTASIANQGWMIIPVITVSSLFFAVLVIYDKTLRLAKKTSIIGATITGSAIINVVLNIVLIPRFGIIGAAYATLIAYLFSGLIIMFFSRKTLRFHSNRWTIGKCLFGSFIIGGVAYVWNPQSVLSLSACILCCMGMYGLVLIATKALTKQDIHFFLSVVNLKK